MIQRFTALYIPVTSKLDCDILQKDLKGGYHAKKVFLIHTYLKWLIEWRDYEINIFKILIP